MFGSVALVLSGVKITTLAPGALLTFRSPDETLIYLPHWPLYSVLLLPSSNLTSSLISVLQEVEDEAQREEASGGREEAVFGARVHEDPCGGFRSEGVGGAPQRDRPQRMARQQQ